MLSARVAEDCLTFALRTRVLDLVAVGGAGHGSWSGRLDRGEMEVEKKEATHCDTDGRICRGSVLKARDAAEEADE